MRDYITKHNDSDKCMRMLKTVQQFSLYRFHDLLDVFVVAITCKPNENGENEVPNTEQPADNSSNRTMTATLSIGIICVLLLIGIVAAYFAIQYVRKRRHNTERWALIPTLCTYTFASFPVVLLLLLETM